MHDTTTSSETHVGISSPRGSRNGSASILPPMNTSTAASPMWRYRIRSMTPASRKYSARSPTTARMLDE